MKLDIIKLKEDYKLFKYFLNREIKSKYLGNIAGFTWVFIQPIFTLLIYWFVFGVIFKQRIPDAENIGFIVYLAIGFWPWLAFSDSILKTVTTITENSDLVEKVNLDFKLLVLATISATYVLNMTGFVVVLISLVLFAENFYYANLLLIIIPISIMYILAIGIGLILSSVQVFIKDTLQIVTTFITMWFFLTPILYSEAIIPDKYVKYLQLNPLYYPIKFIHNALLFNNGLPWEELFFVALIAVIILYLGIKIFNKLEKHFIDFN